MKSLKRLIPLLIIILLMVLVYFTDAFKFLDYETIRYHHNELTELVNNHPISAPVIFIGSYAVITLLSVPIAIFASLIGGFLFRQPWCTIYVVIGATTGATLLFLAAKTAFGNYLKRKAGPRLKKLEKGFNKNAASYLLFLRFVPLIPFWLVNLAPAFFNVRLSTYIWTTIIGITPGAFVTTLAGRGLNTIFETSEEFSASSVLNPQLTIALIGLGILALLPIVVKKFREKKKHDRQ